MIVSQPALLDAFQEQPIGIVTPTLPVVEAAVTDRLVGESVPLHAAPAWFTVKGCPPIVMTPERGDDDGFAPTLYDTVPLPDPLDPDVIVSHVAFVDAVQLQPCGSETATLPVPVDAPTETFAGWMTASHGAPSCVNVNVRPAIVSVPVRASVEGLSGTL